MTRIVSINPSPNLAAALAGVRDQMRVNLECAKNGPLDVETLRILQSHIEDHLKEIERHAGLPVTPYPPR